VPILGYFCSTLRCVRSHACVENTADVVISRWALALLPVSTIAVWRHGNADRLTFSDGYSSFARPWRSR
jgi:hypothetical protein